MFDSVRTVEAILQRIVPQARSLRKAPFNNVRYKCPIFPKIPLPFVLLPLINLRTAWSVDSEVKVAIRNISLSSVTALTAGIPSIGPTDVGRGRGEGRAWTGKHRVRLGDCGRGLVRKANQSTDFLTTVSLNAMSANWLGLCFVAEVGTGPKGEEGVRRTGERCWEGEVVARVKVVGVRQTHIPHNSRSLMPTGAEEAASPLPEQIVPASSTRSSRSLPWRVGPLAVSSKDRIR